MSEPAPVSDCLDDARLQFRKYKKLADDAIAQSEAPDLFRAIDGESNSIAIVMKHMTGNMRSRWTHFLDSDGEKPDRDRDSEFELREVADRAMLLERWDAAWDLTLATLDALTPADLVRIVAIRGEAHTVVQAIHRQLAHYAYHVGQIVLLARHYRGTEWRSLSIPRGQSREHEVARDGSRYRPQ